MAGHELAISFKTQIQEKHAEGQRLDDLLRDVVLRKLNVAREVGILLQEARDSLDLGGYTELRKGLDIEDNAIIAYLSFSRKHAEPISDFREALRNVKAACQASGLLEIAPGHGPQIVRPNSFFSQASSILMRLTAIYRKFIGTNPLGTWTLSSLEQFGGALAPIVKIHADVCAAIRRKK